MGDASERYPEAYRHFDTMIWQTPAWSSAVFALAMQTAYSDDIGSLAARVGVEEATLLSCFLLVTALILFGFSLVMLRFRQHQAAVRRTRPKARPFGFIASAQNYTQLSITLEAVMLVWLGLSVYGLPGQGLLVGGVPIPLATLAAAAIFVVWSACLFAVRKLFPVQYDDGEDSATH
jgi:hypothetical protein